MNLPKIRKISTKVALSFVLVVLLQGLLSILTLNYVTRQAMEASLADQRYKTRLLIERYIADAKKEMVVKADLLSGQAKTAGLIARRDDWTLSRELAFYLAPLKLDTILVVDADGDKVLTVGNEALAEVLLKRSLLGLIEAGQATTIAGEGNRIHLWVFHEIVVDGKRAGMLGIAQSLDRSFIGRIEEISSTVMLLALRKTILVNGRLSDNVFIEYSRRVSADPQLGASGSIKSYVYKTITFPDYPELELVFFIDTTPQIRLLSSYVTSTLLILAATLVVAIWTSLLLYRFSFQKPFAAFQDAIRKISRGDLSFRFSQRAEDEFADLEREFEEMTSNLNKLEQKLQISSRMAAIGEMVAGVAHQIRNPLAVMKVSAEMIRDGLADADGLASREGAPPRDERLKRDIRPLVEMIASEVDSLSSIITKFLDFTRPLQVKPEEVEMEEFLSRSVSLLPLERWPGRDVRVEVSPGAERGRFDRHLVEQVVHNLVANALEASDPGGEVLVSADRAEGALHIRVKDRGRGMGEDVRSQLFHPFFTTKSDGTGLGLSIAHRIIEEHGGSIDVRSEPGAGTEFAVTLQEG